MKKNKTSLLQKNDLIGKNGFYYILKAIESDMGISLTSRDKNIIEYVWEYFKQVSEKFMLDFFKKNLEVKRDNKDLKMFHVTFKYP